MVDRMEVEVLQGMKLTITNKSIGLTFFSSEKKFGKGIFEYYFTCLEDF